MNVIFTRDQLAPAAVPSAPECFAPAESSRVYFDTQRHAYDVGYHVIEPISDSATPTPENLVRQGAAVKELAFPSPVGFASKEDYLEAVLQWKERAEAVFAYGRLPVPVSSMYYRPASPSVFNPGDEAARRFKPELSPCLPLNFNKMLDLILSGEPINPDEEFPVQVPHRKVVTLGNQVTSERQWQSEFAPPEPNPMYYDMFERYAKAYQQWSHAARSTMGIRIPSPEEFGPKLRLDTVTDTTSTYSPRPVAEQKDQALDLSWVNDIREKEVKDEDKLLQFLQEPQRLWISCQPLPGVVFGVDQSRFFDQLQQFGVYEEARRSDRPVRPFAFLEMRSNEGADKEIANVVMDTSLTEMQVIFQLMKIDFDNTDFQQAMNMKKRVHKRRGSSGSDGSDLHSRSPIIDTAPFLNNMPILREHRLSDAENDISISDSSESDCESDQESMEMYNQIPKTRRTVTTLGRSKQGRQHKGMKVLRFLRKRLKPLHITKSVPTVRHSPYLRAKMSILLRTLVNTKFGVTLFDELLLPTNINSLYETVSVLLTLANFPFTLMSPCTEDEFATKLSQFHLLYSLIQDQGAVWFKQFRTYILEKCRRYSLDLSKAVCDNPEIRNELWQSLTSDGNEKSRLMHMVALSSVLNMNRIVLGSDFVQRANEVSKYRSGQRFLLRFIYNDNAFNTTLMFFRNPVSPDDTYTDYFVTIFAYMMSQLVRHLKSHHLVYDASVLLPLFKETELSNRLSLLLPIARLCCLSEVAQRARQTSYQKKLSELCTKIINSPTDTIGKLKLLLPFSKVSVCAESMVTERAFLELLTRGLYSRTVTEFLLTWKLLSNISQFEPVIVSLMKTPDFTYSFHRMQEGRRDVAENILEFLLSAWDSSSPTIRDAAAQGMLQNLGIFACLPNLASQRFEHPATKQLVEKFIARAITCTDSSTPNQTTFANQLKTHLTSVGVESRKGTVILRNRPLLDDLP